MKHQKGVPLDGGITDIDLDFLEDEYPWLMADEIIHSVCDADWDGAALLEEAYNEFIPCRDTRK